MATKDNKRYLTRRELLRAGSLVVVGSLAYACTTPAQPSPTTAPAATKAATAAATQAAATKAAGTVAPAATVAAGATQAPAATKAAAPAKRGGTFSMARTANVRNLSGIDLARGNFAFIRALYNTLIHLDGNLNPQPELATAWQFSADGRVMTLDLRQGVKFHSGKDFTSEDVKFSWEYGKHPETGSPQMRSLFNQIKEVRTPDRYKVELAFDQPNPLVFDILDTLCMFDSTMVAQINTKDAGSGPFTVTAFVPNTEIRMQRFANYWEQGKPYMDEYIVRTLPDEPAMVLNFETQVLDAVWAPAAHEVARLRTQGGVVADPGAGAQGMFHLMANITKGPLGEKRVRQALNFAIDRERCVRTGLAGTIEHTCLMWPRGSWAYFSDLENRYSYNLDRSRALLAEAGQSAGFDTSILVSSRDNPPQLVMGQIIQADLAKLNIRARIEDVEATLFNTRTRSGDFDLCVHNYGRANRDPGTTLAGAVIWYPKAENGPIGFDLPNFVQWRDQAIRILDREQRRPLYRQIQELMLDESFSMAIAGNQSYWIYRDYVEAMSYSRESSPYVGNVWLDK
ncbi:MAG: ABC transporter substrate-binding protein [Chloroflexota bacterium]